MREDEVLKNVRAIFDYGQSDSALIVGNGDDGAVLGPRSELTVLASDMAVEEFTLTLPGVALCKLAEKLALQTWQISALWAAGQNTS